MELLFLIFKIILIVLLAVVGLVLLLLGLILLVPIRYEISGSVGDSWELALKGKITYCLSILKLIVSYQNGQTDFQIYLFGFQKKLKEAEDVMSEAESEKMEEGLSKETLTEETLTEEVPIERNSTEQIQEADGMPETASESIDQAAKQPVQKEAASQEEPAVQKESAVFEESATQEELLSDEGFFPEDGDEDIKPQSKKKKKRQKKEKEEKKESKFDFAFIKQQLTDEHNRSVVKKIFSELGYLLKHFKFRKIQTDLVFSAGDPAATGQILGILCMLPVLYRYEFNIVPDFETEEMYIKGSFLAAGKIRLIHVLITALRLILDKEVRLVAGNVLSMLK